MDLHLPTPTAFPAFPYEPPYEIQTQLMRHLYESIEGKKVTVVESPTGTGKTLSLLCASLTWLSDERERARKGKMKEMAGGDAQAKDWVIEQTLARIRREMEADEQEYEERLSKARRREDLLRRAAKGRVVKRQKVVPETSQLSSKDEDDVQFLPETDQPDTDDGEMHISPALRALMAKVEKGHIPGSRFGQTEEEITCTKIYYASRTHSQLSQVLPELSKLKLKGKQLLITDYHPPSIPSKRASQEDEDEAPGSAPSTRSVSLGSRKQLCINDNLRARARDLDEACRELLGEKDEKRCPHLPPTSEEEKLLNFRDQILASPKDIEDLATAGRISNTCPYFGSRRAIPQAELVTLPYNLLLQKSAREALGVNLKDQIILIDEAHNLIPTLLSLSTVNLSSTTLALSFHQVCVYVSRFKTRLSAINMLHLKRLVVFLDALKKYIGEWQASRSTTGADKTEVMTPGELIGRLGKKVAGINLLEIESYLKKSKIARKIAGYADKQAEKEAGPSAKNHTRKGMVPPLHVVEDFMLALMNINDDGRVTFSLVGRPGQEGAVDMKYQLLNPSPHFMEIVEEARSVVLAGGTMSPISDIVNQLFAYLPEERFSSFSCGHIIPEENLQALVVSKGPTGSELEFKADKQSDPTAISQLGLLLLNFANVVPDGLIVFFPSYRFLNGSKAVWTQSGMMDKFNAKKQVFFEPEGSSEVDQVLQEYAAAVKKPPEGMKGALLFAVIGAKLSEGLNFADDLARGVVIIGLPFANLGSPELRERLKYVKRLEEQQRAAGKLPHKEKNQKDAAAELYENMCMNSVNQSIGRAIRHRGDWASLLLVDKRYATPSIRNKLPKWIGRKLVIPETFGGTVKEMGAFYRSRKLPAQT